MIKSTCFMNCDMLGFTNCDNLNMDITDRLINSNIFRQYKDLIYLTKNIETLENFKEFARKYEGTVFCTIDGYYYEDFKDDTFTVCRVNTKNVALYLDKDFNYNATNVHVFDDKGIRIYQGEIIGLNYINIINGYTPHWKEIFSYLGLEKRKK